MWHACVTECVVQGQKPFSLWKILLYTYYDILYTCLFFYTVFFKTRFQLKLCFKYMISAHVIVCV